MSAIHTACSRSFVGATFVPVARQTVNPSVDGPDYCVLWSPLYNNKEDDADLRAETESKLNTVLPGAVEKRVALLPVSSRQSKGLAFLVTDKDFKPGVKADDYPYMLSLTLQTGNVRSTITVLSHSRDPKFIQQMLAVWKTLRYQGKPD